MGKYFGTDGVRGNGDTYITDALSYRIGRFIGHSKTGKQVKVLIGRDTRLSGQRISDALIKGLIKSGASAYDLGVTTTPSVSYLVETNDFDYGIMISASHNPYTDNGIKVFAPSGEKLDHETELLIEEYIDRKEDDLPVNQGDLEHNYFESHAMLMNYLEYVKSKACLNGKTYKILLDCAHGSACVAAKTLFGDLLHQDITLINDTYTGKDINLNCGSTHLEMIQEEIKKGNYDVGFAFDGDADRLMSITPNGDIIDGDFLMCLSAFDMKARGTLNNDKIVITSMSNLGLKKALKANGLSYEEVDVGDKYVQARLKEKNLSLGGEQSGHVIYYQDLNTGCGLLSAVHALNILTTNEGKNLDELRKLMRQYPQLIINVHVNDKDAVINNELVKNATAKVAEILGDDGRILVRKSGTEQLIRVMVEAKDNETCKLYCEQVVEVVNQVNNAN